MLPVAFEVLSVRSPHPAHKPDAASGHEGSTPFADMLDDASAAPDRPAAKGPPSEPAKPPSAIATQGDVAAPESGDDTIMSASVPPAFVPQVPVDEVPVEEAPVTADTTAVAAPDAEVAPPDPDARPDDGETAVDALLTAIATVTGVPVPPAAPPKKDTKPSDPATDNTGGAGDTKEKADSAPADADNAVPATVAAVAVSPTPDAPATATDPVAVEPETKTPVTAVTAAVADVDPQLAKSVETDGKGDRSGNSGKTESDTAKSQTIAKSDVPVPSSTPPKTDAAPPPAIPPAGRQPAEAPNQAPNQAPATAAGHTDKAANTRSADSRQPAAHHDLPAPDAAAAAKSANTPQPMVLLQTGSVTAPAADQAAPAPAAAMPQAVALPVAGIAVEIAGKALAGKNRFEIRLDPPELGRIHVRLDVDHDGRVTSHITADRSDTFDLLRRDAPALERALQDAGMKTANNGLQFSLRDHGFGRHEQPAQMHDAARVIVRDDTLDVESIAPVYRSLTGLRAGLDIRV